jgi:hypothetical protein
MEQQEEVGLAAEETLYDKILRAVKLDADFYSEVMGDRTANRQALMVVVVSSLISGFGVGFAAAIIDGGLGFFGGLLVGFISSMGGWLVWALYSWWFTTTILRDSLNETTYKALIHRGFMRVLGFSNAPRALSFFYFLPYIGWLIALAASVWALIAGIRAMSETLHLKNSLAVAGCAVGWVPYMLIVFLTASLSV